VSEPVFWVGVDFSDRIPDGDEMQSIADSIGDSLDSEVIVTTREVEPMNKDEREEYVENLISALED